MEAVPKIRQAGKICGGRVVVSLGRIFAKRHRINSTDASVALEQSRATSFK